MTSDIRASESTSMPFVALTTMASAATSGAAVRTTARSPCDGTAMTTKRAASIASVSDAVGVTPGGSATSGRYRSLVRVRIN
jgi:hypothetical protein